MHENVYTIAVLPAKQGRIDELLSMLHTLADATRREHGCIEYGFYRAWVDGNTLTAEEMEEFEMELDDATFDRYPVKAVYPK